MVNRSQLVLLIIILLLVGAMIGFAVSEYFSSKYVTAKNPVQRVVLPLQPIHLVPDTPVYQMLQVNQTVQAEPAKTDNIAQESVQSKLLKTPTAKQIIPLELKNQQLETELPNASVKKQSQPLMNALPKNSFREVDRSSQTVHTSVAFSHETTSQLRSNYSSYNGDDSIGIDGRVVLEGDEYTVNPRPLKRKAKLENSTGMKQETYTYYRVKPQDIPSGSDKNVSTKPSDPILSFIGTLLNGKANGYGTGTYANGDTYKGNWVNNAREGYGTFTTKSGEEFRGNYKNDMRNGYGRLYNKIGQILQEGYWVNNIYKK